MSRFEVPTPILNGPFDEPAEHWIVEEGRPPERRPGRRPAAYWYRPPTRTDDSDAGEDAGTQIVLLRVNRIRERVSAWRAAGYPGVTRTTDELLRWWRRDGRRHRLFFAQIEAAETVIFLTEARPDLRQGIEVPSDLPSEERRAEGFTGFRRYGCKMATGTGKTTVMAMLAAWSILNKGAARGDARFSDVVLVVCPNVTIRNRLAELDPTRGEASLYRRFDLVPEKHMPALARGAVIVTNWHAFAPQASTVGGVSARVARIGRAVVARETITVGAESGVARGRRTATIEDLRREAAAGLIRIVEERRDRAGAIRSVDVEVTRYVESDTAVVDRILRRRAGSRGNVLVFNDEAHHAYRVVAERPAGWDDMDEDDRDEWTEGRDEATVWIDGLDRVQKLRGINFCIDLSATPYFLAGAGHDEHRPFPWIVSDFGLVDAIESGLVKIPQFAVRDSSGQALPVYFNLWRYVVEHLRGTDRTASRGTPKPEAVLKWAHTPLVMLASMWDAERAEWAARGEPRPPVLIVVCRNTKLAKVVHEWISGAESPAGVPPCRIDALRNGAGAQVTVRVDTKVIHETDTDAAKSDESAWMRATLDTVGRLDWPRDGQGRAILPEGFEELAGRMKRPLHPPGRDVRCIVSVGMLTEGWDCATVTHVVGLRAFSSQLLCEQVVGRALRRPSYDVGPDGRLSEEVAKVLGVPFNVIPCKVNSEGPAPEPARRVHVHADESRAAFAIEVPRVEGYVQAAPVRLAIDWDGVVPTVLDRDGGVPHTQVKAGLPDERGRIPLSAPGRVADVTFSGYRTHARFQQGAFDLATALVADVSRRRAGDVPAHVLFPQALALVNRYVRERVEAVPPWRKEDAVLTPPFTDRVLDALRSAVEADVGSSDTPELPRIVGEPFRTADVDFWTTRDCREAVRSHVNRVVMDTDRWEQSAAFLLDTHDAVEAFVKNAGLGFVIPYLHDGTFHEYVPDFVVRVRGGVGLVLEVKGYDPRKEAKRAAAERWARAVTADGRFGRWTYARVDRPGDVLRVLAAGQG